MDCTTKTLMIIIIIGFLILFYMNSNLSINNSSVDTFENINTSELAPKSVASSQFENPQDYNINGNRNNLGTEQRVLDQLMQEVDTGNNFLVNSPPAEQYRQKAKSINSSDTYKAISYKDSQYRQDFGNDAESVLSKDELNNVYADSLVFKNNEYSNNDDFKGYAEYDDNWGNADIKGFAENKPLTQQQKVLSLYDSNQSLFFRILDELRYLLRAFQQISY